METKETRNIEVLKHRSYVRCLRDGMAIGMKYMGVTMRLAWPTVVAFALMFAWFLWLESGVLQAVMEGRMGQAMAVLCVDGVLLALAEMGFYACVLWHQRRLVELGFLPEARLWREYRSIGRTFLRVLWVSLASFVLWMVVLLLCGVLVTGCGMLTEKTGGASWAWAMAVGMAIVLGAVLVWLMGFTYQLFMEYMMGDGSLKDAFRSFAWGRRYLSRTIVVSLLSLFVMLVLWLLVSLPMLTCRMVDGYVVQMLMEGETAVLPSYYSFLRFFAFLLSGVGCCLTLLLVLYPLCLNWGSIHAMEQERTEAMAETL